MTQTNRILLALVLGLLAGTWWAARSGTDALAAADLVQPVGTAWLNALRMTIVPLVVALLVTGIATTAEAARASRLATRAILLFVALLWLSALIGAVATPLLLRAWPLDAAAAEALRGSFATARPVGDVPPFSEFLSAIVPTNPVAAAAEDAFLPLILFTTVFAFAVTRLPAEPRATLVGFFRALADAMLVMIRWILWLAPLGVLALAFVVGARAGTAALGALGHYVVIVAAVGGIVWLLSFPLAIVGGSVAPGRFLRATGPAQAVALSTQSSLASLPAMLAGAERLGIRVSASGVTLPLAVAIFRATGPCMNIAVAIYVAHVFGMELGPTQLAAGVAAAAITTMGAVSLPGSISFVSSIAPIAMAMGVPVEPLALLVAVETLPDLMRTVGNVSMDVATTAVIARHTDTGETTETDALIEE